MSFIRELHDHDLKCEKGKEILDIYKHSVRICREYSIPTVLLAEFAASKVNNKYEVKKLAETIKEYMIIADDNGFRIAYESFVDLDTMLLFVRLLEI